jgi:hypothetical protein
MKIVSFIERCQGNLIERTLRHCGLWEGPLRTLACARVPPHGSRRDPSESRDLELVADPEFREAQAEASREPQSVLDPDFFRRRPKAPFLPPATPGTLAVRADCTFRAGRLRCWA